ncbi:hypothetical protein ACFWWS_38185, partial [Streptomyces sp. NPDC059083]|uniref:Rv0361 family membrane protein n=1 Tax=Streptomyces sp. NPDC059083 TaxID=3346721 RepID=UPI003678646F
RDGADGPGSGGRGQAQREGVKSVDAIQITGDAALAQATVYTAADPSKTSARTFDLRNEGGSWKVCDPQNGH